MKLVPGIKATWLDALRSGKYAQAKESLTFENSRGDLSYCCLGVLLEVCPAVAKVHATTWREDDETPSEEAREIAGLSSAAERHLIKMNDDEGKDFAEIADYIEANL